MFRSQTKKTWGQCRCAVNDLREKKKEDFQSHRIRPGEQCSTHEELYEKLPPALQCEKEKINRRGSGNPNTKNNSKHIKEIHYSLIIDRRNELQLLLRSRLRKSVGLSVYCTVCFCLLPGGRWTHTHVFQTASGAMGTDPVSVLPTWGRDRATFPWVLSCLPKS